jgi:hypothetical protein
MKHDSPPVFLTVPADPAWIPVVQSVAETGARIFRLDRTKGLRLAMGMEEVLLYLSQVMPGTPLKIEVGPDATAVRAVFSLDAEALDLSAMNITASPSLADADGQNLPMLLASRMSDGFSLTRSGRQLLLTLFQEHVYPAVTPVKAAPAPARPPLRVERAREAALIADACARVLGSFPADRLPSWFSTPARGVDLLLAGRMHLALLRDGGDAVCGLLCWQAVSGKSVVFSGPWLLSGEKEGAALLLEEMINSLARGAAVSLVSDPEATPGNVDFAGHGFELLATLPDRAAGQDVPADIPVWFRHLREDDGLNVWAHSDFAPFLEETYRRLFLIRTVQPIMETGVTLTEPSVFAAALNKERRQATITPLLNGADNRDNIAAHLNGLKTEGYEQILFRIDLAEPWQAALGGELVRQGCRPILVLPHAGRADVVVFRYV